MSFKYKLNIIPRRYLSRSEWFFWSQGGCSEGGRRHVLLWLHDLSRPKGSCFVPYIVDALENEAFK